MSCLLSRQGRQVGFESEERCIFKVQRGVKCYKIQDPKDKKTILSRDDTFDEDSTMKPTDSQQVESKKTTEVSQQVESVAIPRTPGSSVVFEIPPTMTRDENHVTDEDTEDIENQGQGIGQVQDSFAAGKDRRNPQKPTYSLQI